MLFVAGVEGYLSGGSDTNQGSLRYKLKSVTNIASLATYLLWWSSRLPFKLGDPGYFLARLLLKVLKYLRKKYIYFILTSVNG
jgi:hypothetical protein